MAKYTLDPVRYDLDDIYAYTDTNDERLQILNDPHITHYRTKTIKSGNVLECEIYPVWNTYRATGRARKTRESRKAQKSLNAKNATKNLIRLINANFTDDDIWGTVTYSPTKLPLTVEAAQKEMQKYISRLKYYAERHGYPPLKYVYVTEFEDDPEKGKKRVHHHFVTNFPDRDVAEKLWRNGARTQTRRLQADENGYEGMARYISKDPRGSKRYVASKNLQKPQITIADCKFTRNKVNRLVNEKLNRRAVFEQMYKGYNLTSFTAKQSVYVSGAYVYVKMARSKQKEATKREIHRE